MVTKQPPTQLHADLRGARDRIVVLETELADLRAIVAADDEYVAAMVANVEAVSAGRYEGELPRVLAAENAMEATREAAGWKTTEET